jgi:hypothetical protein
MREEVPGGAGSAENAVEQIPTTKAANNRSLETHIRML